jgi:hypothetical protein
VEARTLALSGFDLPDKQMAIFEAGHSFSPLSQLKIAAKFFLSTSSAGGALAG